MQPVDLVLANDDLVTEILLRLPTKSVLESKLVSKKWLSIISNPEFATCHTRMINASRGITVSALVFKSTICRRVPPTYTYVSLHDERIFSCSLRSLNSDIRRNTIIEQSCNGLFLCSQYEYNRDHVTITTTRYYVINPATGEFDIIPILPSEWKSRIDHFNLAFDPSCWPHYRVVNVQWSDSKLYVHSYSSQTKNWKRCVERDDSDSLRGIFKDGTYWNGSLVWINSIGTGFRFSLDQELLIEVPKPPIKDSKNYIFFGECGRHLHFVMLDSVDKSHNLVVYEMEKDWSTWSLKYSVAMDMILMACRNKDVDHSTFKGRRNKLLALSLIEGDCQGPWLVMNIDDDVVFYDLKENTCKKLIKEFLFFRPYKAFKCIDTLSCL